jgi:hypothetical protein
MLFSAGRRMTRGWRVRLLYTWSVIVMLVASALSAGGAAAAVPQWRIVSSPDIGGGGVLGAVSCTSAVFCMAAGDFGAERWNGAGWSVVNTPTANTVYKNEFLGVSCTSGAFCMAAGDFYNGSVWRTLIERWNGTKWAILRSPNAGSKDNHLSGASCVSTTLCMSVGHYKDTSGRHTLIEQWNGTTWNLVSSPNASSKDYLHGVSCTGTAFCAAVGNYHDGSGIHTLIELWNGIAWSLVSSPNPPGSTNNQLLGTNCTSTTFCAAVGFYNYLSGDQTLTELWNGARWSLLNSPNPGGSDILSGVSCTGTSTFCMAAGEYTSLSTGYGQQTLIEGWNGTAWSVLNSPNRSGSAHEDALGAVGCASDLFCMAVGQSAPAFVEHSLIEKYSD